MKLVIAVTYIRCLFADFSCSSVGDEESIDELTEEEIQEVGIY